MSTQESFHFFCKFLQLPKLYHFKVIDVAELNKVGKKIMRSSQSMQITSKLSIFHKK